MKRTFLILTGLILAFVLGMLLESFSSNRETQVPVNGNADLKLGAFSISLSVNNLAASRDFYENLGFKVFGGDTSKNYLIMKNEHTLIGLFKGMFKGNLLTFNPGWDDNAKNLEVFDDVRLIQKQLKSNGFAVNPEADEKTTGPAYFMVSDPDGNVLLFDQHR